MLVRKGRRKSRIKGCVMVVVCSAGKFLVSLRNASNLYKDGNEPLNVISDVNLLRLSHLRDFYLFSKIFRE